MRPPAERNEAVHAPARIEAGPAPGPIPAPLSTDEVRAIIAGIMLAMFLSALEQTIIAPALPAIGQKLGDLENLSWVVGAYLLAATAVTPLFGKLSDIFGRRRILLIGVSVFIAGSIGCALAPNMATLIAARAVQGIGGGGILPIAQAIIADLVSPRERSRYQTQSAAMFMIASVVGPLLGGFFTDRLHWSLIFWINLPLGALALLMSARALTRLPRNERPHTLDWAGAALMVAAALSLMLAMSWGGGRYSWGSPPILALLAGSAGLWALFGLRLAHASEPFIPLAVLREGVVAGNVAAGFFSIGTIVGLSIYLPLYLELVRGASATQSGALLIAFTGGTVCGAFAGGRSLGFHRHYKRIPAAGLMLAIVALALLAAAPQLPDAGVALLLFLCGAGIGPMYPITTVLTQNAVLAHQFGVVTGTVNFFRLLGGTIVVAGFGAIILGNIGASGESAVFERWLRAAPPLAVSANTGAAHIFAIVFMAAGACLAAALAAFAFVEERPLRGPAQAAHPARPPLAAE